MSDKTSSSVKTLWERFKNLAEHKYEYTRLTFAETLIVILSMMILCFVGIFIAMIILFLVSTVLSKVLAEYTGELWSLVIVSGFNLLILLFVILLRKPLIINPISKFITRLIL